MEYHYWMYHILDVSYIVQCVMYIGCIIIGYASLMCVLRLGSIPLIRPKDNAWNAWFLLPMQFHCLSVM